MPFFLISGLILILLILLIVYLVVIIRNKIRARKLVAKSKTILQKIDDFYTDFSDLTKSYVTKNMEQEFFEKWKEFYLSISGTYFPRNLDFWQQIDDFLRKYHAISSEIEKSNKEFLHKEEKELEDFFSNIDGKSLDQQQREVVLSEDEKILVLAGAGSGKTLTISAKVKYLCQIKGIAPEDILLISFTNKSAEEMTERIQKKLGVNIQASTFHKFGLEVLKKELGYRPDVYEELNQFVHQFFDKDLLSNPKMVKIISEYFTYYADIPTEKKKCSSLGELYELEKNTDLETLKSKYNREKYIEDVSEERAQKLTTLNGEHVKSLEETKIANYLFMHGVNYEYEKLYPFESEDPTRKAYRPDFYLPDYDIYLEHFGINRNYRTPWLSKVEEEKYIDGINWKRDFHKKNGTKLIETYSYYVSEGNLFSELDRLLAENNVVVKEQDFLDVFETIYAKKSNKYFEEFIKLCCTFIVLFKSNNYKEDRFKQIEQEARGQNNPFLYKRTVLFLEIIQSIYCEYEKYLTLNKAIDFSDMINEAADKINSGAEIHNYKYVIVDEYQDISNARFNLLNAIIKTSGAKLLCVGDDWQSIYRFAGSDISLFTDFQKYIGAYKLLKIEKTYRNSQELINEASKFISKNPKQLNKELKSNKQLNYPLVFWGYDSDPTAAIDQIMRKIIADFGTDKSIMFLGRINYDIEILGKTGLFTISGQPGFEKIKYNANPSVPVSFLTVHKSKGLEADNVIILNFKNDKLGFPNQISDDVVLNYVLTQAEDYLFGEERRLFYVAITRTRNRTFVITDNRQPSIFFRDFCENNACCFIHTDRSDSQSKTLCPRCGSGQLIKVSHEGRTFIGCTNYPRCDYTLNNMTVLSSPIKCPRCGGFLVKRKGSHHHSFVGCTNYPYCKYTSELPKSK